jgi:vacuolar-type H+-ATPase subunit E/Vma4
MKSLEENIESLSRAMISEAKGEAEQIIAEAQEKAENIRQRAREQAAIERAEILERAQQEASRLRGQTIATTQMKARTMELEHREKLLDQVFTASRKALSSVQQWTDYDEIALRLLRESLTQLRTTEARAQADAVTQKFFTESAIQEISKQLGIHIILGETLKQGTGVVVDTADSHLHFDNTLENRLGRLQNSLRSPVYRLLIGEPL